VIGFPQRCRNVELACWLVAQNRRVAAPAYTTESAESLPSFKPPWPSSLRLSFEVGELKFTLNAVGVILSVFGLIWFLHGVNVLPGSFMTGQIQWAVYAASRWQQESLYCWRLALASAVAWSAHAGPPLSLCQDSPIPRQRRLWKVRTDVAAYRSGDLG
jgi:hypothetical protein